jgi:hypothetical protein
MNSNTQYLADTNVVLQSSSHCADSEIIKIKIVGLNGIHILCSVQMFRMIHSFWKKQ